MKKDFLLLRPIRVFAFRKIIKMLIAKRIDIINYNKKESQRTVFDLVNKIKHETDFLLTHTEAIQLYNNAVSTAKVKGEIAEVGSYMGGSAKLLSLACPEKKVLIFDTFAGLPETGGKDFDLKSGEYLASYQYVQNYLKDQKNITITKGFFPDSAYGVIDENMRFSFIHLDVDIYQSTIDSLRYFYDRITPGGAIMSHDYSCEKGVKLAFDEFFSNKPEAVIKLPGSQCLVIKI